MPSSRMTRGRLPAAVYWRRRLAVLSIALVLVLAIGELLTMGSDGASRDTAEQVGALSSPTATTTADPSTSGAADRGAKKGTGKKKSGRGKGGRNATAAPATSPAPSPTPTPTPTTPPPLPEPTGPCADDEVFVTASTDPDTGAVGGRDVTFLLNLQARTSPACTWQVSPDTVRMSILKDHDEVWQSTQCPDVIPTVDVVVRQASVVQVPVVWNAKRSDEGCTDRTVWVLPGLYRVQTTALGGEPTEVTFELVTPVAPTLTQTAQPQPTEASPSPSGATLPG